MEEFGREEAKKILERLDYRHIKPIGKIKTKFPYDMVAKKGTEHLLIEVKYAEDGQGSSGFPVPWICRAYQVLTHMRTISEGWKAQVLIIAKRGDRVSHLFLEPHFEKPWFDCGFKKSDYQQPKIPTWLSWLEKYHLMQG